MSLFADLRDLLEEYLDNKSIESVHEAFKLAEEAHEGQFRQSGDSYISHPVAVAKILAEVHLDYQSIMAALLHDVIEDTHVTKENIASQFGEQVAELVDGVSKLTQIKFASYAEARAENFRKMVLAMVRDLRVILIKLADRLHNMRTLGVLHPQKRRRIARETLEIYAPIANRLGMHAVYMELEDLGFETLYPNRYRILKEALIKNTKGERKELVEEIDSALTESIDALNISDYKIIGRQKHLYSIYKKMRNKHLSFDEISDVFAFRIIVNSVDEIYRVLGVVHNLYKPVPERFKDYIAIPKVNGYQSLHTILFGPNGMLIEIQIRTNDMDHMAQNGIAAHWLYKSSDAVDKAQLRAQQWVKGLLELQKDTGSSLEFIENVRIDLFPDDVYVFTPKGKIMELPTGATLIDFAYAVHTDVGNSCVAGKIDKKLVPLSTPLSSGQTVEVVSSSSVKPNPAWLNFVVTGKARSNIRHALKMQHRGESIDFGKRLLDQALATLSSSWDEIPPENIKKLLENLNLKTSNDLMQSIGLGNHVALSVAYQFLQSGDQDEALKSLGGVAEPIAIKGTEGIAISFAECCRPIPGDSIVGVLNIGYGIQVHLGSCPNATKHTKYADKFVPLQWEDDVVGEFKVDVYVIVPNQRGVLANLASVVAEADSNIDDISVEEKDEDYYTVFLIVSVKNRAHLARVMRKIRSMKMVTKIQRGA